MDWDKTYICDTETYHNIFAAGFLHLPTGNRHTFVLNDRQNDLRTLRDWLLGFDGDVNLVCHNILKYDGPIFRAIVQLADKLTNEDMKRLSGKLFDMPDDFRQSDFYKDIRDYNRKSGYWVEYDTLEITRVNQNRVSLKHAEVMLRWPKLQDLPYNPEQWLNEQEQDALVDYMWNDIGANAALFKAIQRDIKIREGVYLVYNVDVHTENETGIGKRVLDKVYCERAGVNLGDIKDLRSGVDVIHIKDCIGENIKFVTSEFQQLRETIEQKRVYPGNRFKYEHRFDYAGVRYVLGVGGLHSDDTPGIFVTTPTCKVVDLDAKSLYPMIMINNGFYPPHLDKTAFIGLLLKLVSERLAAKLAGKTDSYLAAKAGSLKIVVNSIYGLLGMLYYWLFAPKAMISVTITGQLSLLDLVEKLVLGGITVISANTDGLTCKVPIELEAAYYAICKDWEQRTKLELEYVEYDKYVRRDVNNYITIKPNGSTKTKGIFQNYPAFRYDFGHGLDFYDLPLYDYAAKGITPPDALIEKHVITPSFSKGYFAPIISIALYQYFVHGVAPAVTVRNHWDVTDYLISQRADAAKFDILAVMLDGGDLTEQQQQKTNRYLVTQLGAGVSLRKGHKHGGKDAAMLAGQHVLILNDIDSYAASDYNIKYEWYEKQVWAVIDKIDPPTGKLW